MPHTATLTWQASPDAGSFGSGDGYLVFRGLTQGAETTKLTPTPITALTFEDTNALLGNSWYAVKTSVGGAVSSALEAEAVILPSAPVGPLAIVVG